MRRITGVKLALSFCEFAFVGREKSDKILNGVFLKRTIRPIAFDLSHRNTPPSRDDEIERHKSIPHVNGRELLAMYDCINNNFEEQIKE